MLADHAIERYARQIVVPGIGATGQERLLAATVLVVGDERGCRQAALYLEAAGVGVRRDTADRASADLVVVADTGSLDPAARESLLRLGLPLCWYVTGDDGFRSGVHPASPLPPTAPGRDQAGSALQDAAACDAAAVACAVLLGLPCRQDTVRFDILSS